MNLLLSKVSGTSPALLRVEKFIRNIRAVLRYRKVENIICLVLGLCELAAVDGVQDGTGVFERATLATSGGTGTSPAGVEEPSVGVVVLDLVCQHLCVSHWVEGEEGLCEAGREGRLWFCDSLFGTGHLGGVTRNEVVHRLCRVEF